MYAKLIVILIVVVVLLVMFRPSSTGYFSGEEHAIQTKKMKEGEFNVRYLDRIRCSGNIAQYDTDTGVLTVHPGRYNFTAFSKVTAVDENVSMPGYCALVKYVNSEHITKEDVVFLGSVADAQYGQLSHIQTVLECETTQRYRLVHQCLIPKHSTAYIQLSGNGSTSHVFANISLTPF